ncbi:MAG: TlyA family RNA methyltransferase [Candidatus Schekmanbacteria bacterium]|nr:TlyA family RNA methyltransferase [Candidatus Schekmanbacteria bacterium]
MASSARQHLVRLDQRLVDAGCYASRAAAQQAIRAGSVRVDTRTVSKPGALVPAAAAIEILAPPHPYASRGGAKLACALDAFAVLPQGRLCLDSGVSTGGFTDCLLQRGAAAVIAVDVGYGQIAWRLRCDSRVALLERTNLRYLTRSALVALAAPGGPLAELGWRPSLVTLDLSFISLRLLFAPLAELLATRDSDAAPVDMVALVKPQFEVGPERVGKGGIVRDAEDQRLALVRVTEAAQEAGLRPRAYCESPLRGGASTPQDRGNREFFLYATWGGPGGGGTADVGSMVAPESLEAAAAAVVTSSVPQLMDLERVR